MSAFVGKIISSVVSALTGKKVRMNTSGKLKYYGKEERIMYDPEKDHHRPSSRPPSRDIIKHTKRVP